jgi:predicted nuclease with TOPRIM domain
LHAFRATEEKRKLSEAANASKTKVTGLESELQSALSEKESLEKKFKDLSADHDSLKVKLQESEEKTGKVSLEIFFCQIRSCFVALLVLKRLENMILIVYV